ncbi:hypothetical protein MPSEU_000611300 [Mayamaea pseudoterrestris]|nr:hypothetical protein MPSEU_000611300 [Mayamaea pseudoterrestris]
MAKVGKYVKDYGLRRQDTSKLIEKLLHRAAGLSNESPNELHNAPMRVFISANQHRPAINYATRDSGRNGTRKANKNKTSPSPCRSFDNSFLWLAQNLKTS